MEGQVSTLSDRRGLTFRLYDTGYARPVVCRLKPGQEGLMREAWHRRAVVEGLVGRDPITEAPERIRDVTDVVILREREPGSFRVAVGVLRGKTADLPAEDLIRRGRDVW